MSISIKGKIPYGEPPVTLNVSFTLKDFFNKKHQINLESFRNQNFGFRNTLVRIKNSLYSSVNFGIHHYSFYRQIVTGEGNYLFQKNFISPNFCTSKCRKIVDQNIQTIKEFKKKLGEYGVPVAVILLPDKASQLRSFWPFLWKLQDKYNPLKVNWHDYYETELRKSEVPILNLQDCLAYNLPPFSFLPSGEHWTLIGADATLPTLTFFLSENKFGIFNVEPSDKKLYFSMMALHAETDLYDLLNEYNIYQKLPSHYPYYDYSFMEPNLANRLVLYGDSYTNQLNSVLLASGTYIQDHLLHFENKKLNKDDLFNILRFRAPVILAYTLPNLTSSRVKDDLTSMIAILNDPILFDSNWIKDNHGLYLPSKAKLSFLSNGNQAVLSFKIHKKIKTASNLVVYLNKIKVSEVNLLNKPLPMSVEIEIKTNRGVNDLEFYATGATTPVHLTIPDWRKMSLLINDIGLTFNEY